MNRIYYGHRPEFKIKKTTLKINKNKSTKQDKNVMIGGRFITGHSDYVPFSGRRTKSSCVQGKYCKSQ